MAGTFYHLVHHGQICCMAQVIARDGSLPIIGHLFTPAEHRRKGYAVNLVHRLTDVILAEGIPECGIISDLASIATNKAFIKVGYQPVFDFITLFRQEQ